MQARATGVEPLPELAAVYWRPRADIRRLRRAERAWTWWTLAHVVPFVLVAAGLLLLEPLSAPVALVALAQAWIIPKLFAQRGANVLRPKGRAPVEAERRALGLLGDLTGHAERDLLARTGVVMEQGRFGVWLVGEAGALLVRRGGRRVHCFCVRARELEELPPADRIAHLLLALRADEAGFATVANREFVGARWRLRRRLPAAMRPALEAAGAAASVTATKA